MMIELLCTLTGIVAGVAVVASLLNHQGDRAQFEASPARLDSDKIRGIADQLQVISSRVAANVSAHSEKVGSISGQLADSEIDQPERILSTIQEIILANESMQGQLADARKRIAAQSQMIEQASQQARTDALTGLANRRALDEFLNNCIANYAPDEFVGLLLLDIDHFKSFNDSFGHTTGDAVLSSFARAIATCCGQECYAARFGGEEFAVILTARTEDDLARKAAEIRYYVSEQVISYEDLQLKITASAGVCILLRDDTINAAYERADEGLYQSKKSGRNCGHWLGSRSWAPFPAISGEPRVLANETHNLRPIAELSAGTKNNLVAEAVHEETGAKPKTGAKQNAETQPQQSLEERASMEEVNAAEPEATHDILELSGFLSKLDSYMAQLRRADLPASAMMVEASCLNSRSREEAKPTWEAILGLAQLNLRGIDVVCLYRPYTLCIFMPGCSRDAALERAARIQRNLHASKEDWVDGKFPDKLSIAIACSDQSEDVPHFLDRLERALNEAVDAAPLEVVIQDGESCHFQAV
jgi:diguanylate cyclase